MMKKIIGKLVLVILIMVSCNIAFAKEHVVLGIDNEEEYPKILENSRIGLLTNQTGVDRALESSAEILSRKYNLTAIFVPEHGFYGAVKAGVEFNDEKLDKIPVYSLYGSTKKPTEKMLQEIDVMCVDIQDIGIRHYTYVSSMAYVMEECAKHNIPVVVFDRPNPLGGKIQGPVLKSDYKSFIGLYEVPLRHGLTIGEYALYINGEYNMNCNVKIVPMKNWHRNMYWEDTGLLWVGTSPLIPTDETVPLYAVTGVIGDTNLSVGVGTAKPFFYVGSEFADERNVYALLSNLHLDGVKFRPAVFAADSDKYKGKLIRGVEIYIVDKDKVNLPELGYQILYTLKNYYKDKITFSERKYVGGYKIDIALGEDSIRNNIEPKITFARWQHECTLFRKAAEKYFLYE